MMRRIWLMALVFPLVVASSPAAAETTYRLHDGVTAMVHNAGGKEFKVTLDVRDINIYEPGPREVLVKVYDPDGQAVVRAVVPDDGVTSPANEQPVAAWNHLAWYYAWCRMQGAAPMIRSSAFSSPDRLAHTPKRTFTYDIVGGKKGVYRILLVGAIDHYVTLKIDPELAYGVSGHPDWLYGHGEMYRRSFIYVPRGTKGLYVLMAEYDLPRTRRFKLQTPDGKTLAEGDTSRGYVERRIDFESPGQYDDAILRLDVSAGPGDFLLDVKHLFKKDPEVVQRGEPAVSAVLAPDEATAKAVQGGAIYHDGRRFWQMYQVRFHEWLKRLKPEDFVVTDGDGKTIEAKDLPQRPGFFPVNGNHWRPPLCDTIMHHWPANKNRAALNLALRDLAAGLRSIGPNDHVAVVVGGPFGNMGYEFSNYAWHYWRPSWHVLQDSDAPDEVKQVVREAMLVCGDRLAFCRSWARVNGNSFALIPSALRYCYAATGDPLQKELFDTYWERFTSGGWGERVGVGRSGPVQEGFAYAYHYGSYVMRTWQSVLADFEDERFQKVYDGLRTWFSYTLADEQIAAGPWSARTHYYPQWSIEREGPFAWKGLPGPDLTVSVNEGNEWFAARRKPYYVLTYHGRLSPKWNSNANAGQAGYGGGMLCQVHVPGKGPVIASTLNGDYGRGMHPSLWRTFHIHSLVGTTADGRPLVAADSEHFDARLAGETVTSSGEVRDSSVGAARSYTFGPDAIACQVQLKETDYIELLSMWTGNPMHGKVTEAYEMIPFVPNKVRQPKKELEATEVTALSEDGGDLGPLTEKPMLAKQIRIDRGGFGVRIELDRPRQVHRGQANTVLIQLTEKPTPASEVGIAYRLVPYFAP